MPPLTLAQFNALLAQQTSTLRVSDLAAIQDFLARHYYDFGSPGNSPMLATVAAMFKS